MSRSRRRNARLLPLAMFTQALTATALLAQGASPLPELVITRDNTPVNHDCRIVIPDHTLIPDSDGNGVIHITADNLTIEFAAGSTLAGAEVDDRWDQLTGVGVSVVGARNVTLRNLRVRGYRVGVLARRADRLTVDAADLSDNYRRRLASTPLREDPADWLFPHHNDNEEWITTHGAALAVVRSDEVTIRNLRVRRGQNGIVLDRVNHSRIYDNDCSFLSGWGLAMWRSSDNRICSNAFDFCVRGHSEGVYNRGHDSAGILFFEQCNRNTVTHNSATHCGDGFFGFAGREALGETPKPADAQWTYERVGCNDNIFLANRFSHASAHGWEMTFSEGNTLRANHIDGNAICGVWGGYSSDMVIEGNGFDDNGGMPYGNEGGAINIEHGSRNVIRANRMTNNTAAVRLWWDDDGRLLELPGVREGYTGVSGNNIIGNLVTFNDAHHFRAPRHADRTFRGVWFQQAGTGHFNANIVTHNQWNATHQAFVATDCEPGTEPLTEGEAIQVPGLPDLPKLGRNSPFDARKDLAGRENIIMGEWGPWDHETPMLRLRERRAGTDVYDIFGAAIPAAADAFAGECDAAVISIAGGPGPDHARLTITAEAPGVHRYGVTITSGDWSAPARGVIVNTTWDARIWSWTADPMTHLDDWRAEADGDSVVRTTLHALDFNFQSRGPADVGLISAEAAANAGIGRDRFAVTATTTLRLEPGRWRIRTLSDDGLRLFVDGRPRIERWNIHGPTPDEAVFEVGEPRDVELRVEHFEHDGWAALSVHIEPAN